MKTLLLSNVKSHLSALLKEVEQGNEIAISYGKNKKTIAVIIPYSEYLKNKKRYLGMLQGKVSVEFKNDFEMTEEEFLGS